MFLRMVREWSRALVYLDFVGHVSWWIVAITLGSLLLLCESLPAGSIQQGLLFAVVLHAGAALVFLAWMTRDARRSLPAVHREYRRLLADPNTDVMRVIARPELPHWMGGM
jgi:hypothetical protein